MATITVNKHTQAGKLLFEMAKLLSEKTNDIVIENERPRYNKETEKAIRDAKAGIGLIKAKNVDELFEKLKS
jgi:antitoxin component of RelBE/YafQ-DinJ toxin-antitoxin module